MTRVMIDLSIMNGTQRRMGHRGLGATLVRRGDEFE